MKERHEEILNTQTHKAAPALNLAHQRKTGKPENGLGILFPIAGKMATVLTFAELSTQCVEIDRFLVHRD